jgi:hypothetical protein
MVGVDDRWENLKQVRAAGWQTPPGHPDVDPPHEALQLVEQFREAARLPEAAARPEELRRWLAEAEERAADLERVLRTRPVDADAAEKAFQAAGGACGRCHGRYRDVPQGR